MLSISLIKKELTVFFGSPLGWIVPGIFLLLIGLLTWVVPGNYNIPLNGYANLSGLFKVTPWLLLFLIPAIGMQSFALESQNGTLELLLSAPYSNLTITFSKFLSQVLIATISVFPTLIFVFTLQQITADNVSLDYGSIWGSYLGLFLLICALSSISLFASALSKNTVFAFTVSLLFCFFCYTGFGLLANAPVFNFMNHILSYISIDFHYSEISNGVIRLNEVIFFTLTTSLFIIFTELRLELKR